MGGMTLELSGVCWAPDSASKARERSFRLRSVDLEVGPGEFVGLIGPNGSGKTSLLRCAMRHRRPQVGSVRVHGEDVWHRSARWCAQHIAVMSQEFPQALSLTVRELVSMGRMPHQRLFQGQSVEDLRLLNEALDAMGLKALEGRRYAGLSGGEKQRVHLARVMVQRPHLMILDEPTNHLDPRHQVELLRCVRGMEGAKLASLHDLNLAAMFCDRLCVVQAGEIVAAGTPWQVLTPCLLRRVFELDAVVDSHPSSGCPRITWNLM